MDNYNTIDAIYKNLENNFVLYRDLLSVQVRECREDFFCLSDVEHSNLIIKQKKQDMIKHYNGKVYVRYSVAQKLINIANTLARAHPNIALKIVYGFRLPSIQKDYFDKYHSIVKQQNHYISNELELIELTHRGAAAPEVAGHPTGGAVDVGLFSLLENDFLNMGSPILTYENTRKAYTFSPEINQEQLANRMLLKKLMESENFAPYLGEWWHFSYGDKEWAKYYNQPFAFYDQVQDIHQFR